MKRVSSSLAQRGIVLALLLLFGSLNPSHAQTPPSGSRPVVRIKATIPETAEPSPTALVLPGEFTITRDGDLGEALSALVFYSGTAAAGHDYHPLPQTVTIGPNEASATMRVLGIMDELVEKTETVVASLDLPFAGPAAPPYDVDPAASSATVFIRDNSEWTRPIVSIVAVQEFTSEPNPLARIIPGRFRVSRLGSPEHELPVYLRYEGSATPTADYDALPTKIIIPAGEESADLIVFAKQDDIAEETESVMARLSEPSTAPDSIPYTIDPNRSSATVYIHNVDLPPSEPRITIDDPASGEHFAAGADIDISTVAVDPQGYIPAVDFYANGALIGRSRIDFLVAPPDGSPITHKIVWQKVEAGTYTLTAVGFTSTGEKATSPPVRIVVDPEGDAIPVVSVRTLHFPEPAARPIPDREHVTGAFEFTRTGSTAEPLLVFFQTAGVAIPEIHLAQPGVDYEPLGTSILFPAGQSKVQLYVNVIDDQIAEPTETIHLALFPPPPNADPAYPALYRIDREEHSATLHIIDDDQAAPVVLALEVPDPVASEAGILTVIDPGLFVIRRVSGPDVKLRVHLIVGGTATEKLDYHPLKGLPTLVPEERIVEMPAGAEKVEIPIHAIFDRIAEGEETVTLELIIPLCPAIMPMPPECYQLSDRSKGTVIIRDGPPIGGAPLARLLQPLHGAVFSTGDSIQIRVAATDGDALVPKVDFFANGELLATVPASRDDARPQVFIYEWKGAAAGRHTLSARAHDADGNTGDSATVAILVRDADEDAFVHRHLPPAYLPGSPFEVHLRATPPEGTRAFAVEDQPPAGWVVSDVSDEGRFDPETGRVKFGPFFTAASRGLTYRVTPPQNASGPHKFEGAASVDGKSHPIAGDALIQSGHEHHPADANADFKITMDELTAYAAAWKSGEEWPRGPVPIPAEYVTRAGLIWHRGEQYSFVPRQPPLCWTTGDFELAIVLTPQSQRTASAPFVPGVPTEVRLAITPPLNTSAYAVEERIPAGWTVSDISEGGVFDSNARSIRWGLFVDPDARTLTYTVTPSPNITMVGRLSGVISWNGLAMPVGHDERVTSVNPDNRPELDKCEALPEGLKLRLRGPAGQVGVLQSSTDLVTWEDVTTLFLPDGEVEYVDVGSRTNPSRYYRLQMR